MIYLIIAILTMGAFFIFPTSTSYHKPLLSIISGLLWPLMAVWIVMAVVVHVVKPAKVS